RITRLKFLYITRGILNVMRRAHLQHFLLIVVQLTLDLAGRAHNHRTIRYFHTFRNQRIGTNQTMLADPGTVKHDRVYANQRIIADITTVQHHFVAHGNAPADGQRQARIGVQHRTILNIGFRTNRDALVVAANDHVKPDTAFLQQPDIADDNGVIGNKLTIANYLGALALELVKHISLLEGVRAD